MKNLTIHEIKIADLHHSTVHLPVRPDRANAEPGQRWWRHWRESAEACGANLGPASQMVLERLALGLYRAGTPAVAAGATCAMQQALWQSLDQQMELAAG